MKDKLRDGFDKAVKLKEQHDFGRAREILLELLQDDPESSAILVVLGDVCWDMKHLDEAISFFQRATLCSPSSERISLALFHCLWEAERTNDAFGEMKRYLANNESEEYTRLLAGINNS